MKRYVAVFRSRTDVLTFVEDMKKNSAYIKTVTTPKEARIGCGISAEFSNLDLAKAKKLIKIKRYQSYLGIFIIQKTPYGTVTERI